MPNMEEPLRTIYGHESYVVGAMPQRFTRRELEDRVEELEAALADAQQTLRWIAEDNSPYDAQSMAERYIARLDTTREPSNE